MQKFTQLIGIVCPLDRANVNTDASSVNNIANPLTTILSVAMMLRYSFNDETNAVRIEQAVKQVLAQGLRTADIHSTGMHQISMREMGEAVIAAL